MPRFALVEGDVTVLTKAFNALRGGMGTYLAPTASLEGFLGSWKDSTSAFASEAGFIAIGLEGNPPGAATVVLCQFESGAVDAELGGHFQKLSRELLKGFDLQVLRAASRTIEGERLLTLAGFTLDGKIRRLVPELSGMLSDLSMFSLTVDDLVKATEPANFVYSEPLETEVVEHNVSRNGELPLGV